MHIDLIIDVVVGPLLAVESLGAAICVRQDLSSTRSCSQERPTTSIIGCTLCCLSKSQRQHAPRVATSSERAQV